MTETSSPEQSAGTRNSVRSRFAPSTTGFAHPGTMLAALLCWLDAKSRGGHVLLRLEDIEPERVKEQHVSSMQRDLEQLGLVWDAVERQSLHQARHLSALDALAKLDLLYPCDCSRARLRAQGRRAPDGGFAYDNRCRRKRLPAGGWRAAEQPLRVRLEGEVQLLDESGLDLGQEPALVMGDPVVRRRDGAIAYQLAVVVDDGAAAINRVVRGRDIAPSTATQVILQRYLGLPAPVFRHHLLLLEPRGDKLAKLHGSVGAPELFAHYSGRELVGILAHAAGLTEEPELLWPEELLASFSWERVAKIDRVMAWDGSRLHLRA